MKVLVESDGRWGVQLIVHDRGRNPVQRPWCWFFSVQLMLQHLYLCARARARRQERREGEGREKVRERQREKDGLAWREERGMEEEGARESPDSMNTTYIDRSRVAQGHTPLHPPPQTSSQKELQCLLGQVSVGSIASGGLKSGGKT